MRMMLVLEKKVIIFQKKSMKRCPMLNNLNDRSQRAKSSIVVMRNMMKRQANQKGRRKRWNQDSPKATKVYVRGVEVEFSPVVINIFFDRDGLEEEEEIDGDQVISKITGRKVKSWGKNKTVSASSLTAKYAILHKIAVYNWMPTKHMSTVSQGMADLLFKVGENRKFNFGNVVLKEMLKLLDNKVQIEYLPFPRLLEQVIRKAHLKFARKIYNPYCFSKEHVIDTRLLTTPHVNDLRVTADELKEFKKQDKKARKKGVTETDPVTKSSTEAATRSNVVPPAENSFEVSFLHDQLEALDESIAILTDQREKVLERLAQVENPNP